MANFLGESLHDNESRMRYQRAGSFINTQAVGASSTGKSIHTFWSPWIIGELYRVLMWQWFEKLRGNYALCAQLNNLMMEQMSAYFVVSDPKPPLDQGWPSLSDENDALIWASSPSWVRKELSTSHRKSFFA